MVGSHRSPSEEVDNDAAAATGGEVVDKILTFD